MGAARFSMTLAAPIHDLLVPPGNQRCKKLDGAFKVDPAPSELTVAI